VADLAVEIEIGIISEEGLHARPASVLVKSANCFKSDICIVYGHKKLNAKSILGVLSLGATKGSTIILRVEGEDEQDAISFLRDLIGGRLNGDEQHTKI